MDAFSSKPSLLGLPRELRDQICFYLIDHTNARKPPPSPPFAGRRSRGPIEIMYCAERPVHRYPDIALVNHQLRAEIAENVNSFPRLPEAELDLMAKGYCFYPTWTKLPGNVNRGAYSDLNVRLRIFSTEAFRMNDGWPRQPGSGFRTLLVLLNNFLMNGPPFLPQGKDQDTRAPYRINRLSVNVTFHDLYTPATWADTAREILKMLHALADSGIPYPYIKEIKPSVEFQTRYGSMSATKELTVAETCDTAVHEQWERAGFRFALQKSG